MSTTTFTGLANNATYVNVDDPTLPTVPVTFLRAMQDIPSDTEVTVGYGRQYWQRHREVCLFTSCSSLFLHLKLIRNYMRNVLLCARTTAFYLPCSGPYPCPSPSPTRTTLLLLVTHKNFKNQKFTKNRPRRNLNVIQNPRCAIRCILVFEILLLENDLGFTVGMQENNCFPQPSPCRSNPCLHFLPRRTRVRRRRKKGDQRGRSARALQLPLTTLCLFLLITVSLLPSGRTSASFLMRFPCPHPARW